MSKVTASNISLDVTKEQVKQFFSFCGRIEDIEIHKDPNYQTAQITFERASAAKTALLLQDAVLGLNKITITTEDSSLDDRDLATHDEGEDVPQEHKPRTAILAEVLSHGYVLGDQAVQKSIDFDKQNGISARFQSYLASLQDKAQQLDSQFHVLDKAKQVDAKLGGLTDKTKSQATGIQATLQRYFDSLTQQPAVAKVLAFYSEGVSSAQDIHNEARRLANLRQGNEGGEAKAGEVIHESAEKTAEAVHEAAAIPEEKVPKLGSTA